MSIINFTKKIWLKKITAMETLIWLNSSSILNAIQKGFQKFQNKNILGFHICPGSSKCLYKNYKLFLNYLLCANFYLKS
jgi:hypothetical protein